MEEKNSIARIKELIGLIGEADKAYYCDDQPIMTDREYDLLFEELRDLERSTGIVFANSPTGRVSGANNKGFREVKHTKPMLSATKTKNREEMIAFIAGRRCVLSWKLDGLTLVLRYNNGVLIQALTRGEDGLVGEDVTHTVRYLRNIPTKTTWKKDFEVRGEGVVSWADHAVICRNDSGSHPRNVAAGAVRSLTADKGRLSHIDFFAFDLILPGDESITKTEQLKLMSSLGFDVVEYISIPAGQEYTELCKKIDSFDPDQYRYPVDGIMAEYDDLKYGRSLGATGHHENRMLALKWEDIPVSTVFRKVDMHVTAGGRITLSAVFDPVMIYGTEVDRADLHSLSRFEELRLGTGDIIDVYKANRIIPQIAANHTQSGTYAIAERCPCCGHPLEIRLSSAGTRDLYCTNDNCIGRNARRIARFCDKNAMNISGFSAKMVEKLMSYGLVGSFDDLYRLKKHRDKLITLPGIGPELCEQMLEAVENSRYCYLYQFLNAVGIPGMGVSCAHTISEYFYGSWKKFEAAVTSDFNFCRIEGVTNELSGNIHRWYNSEDEQKLFRPVLEEISFMDDNPCRGMKETPFFNTSVAFTGKVGGMNRSEFMELLKTLGAHPQEKPDDQTDYLILGDDPSPSVLSEALRQGTRIITDSQFCRMIAMTDSDAF